MTELDHKIVTAKMRVERLTAELFTATAHLASLGLEKQKMLENAPSDEEIM